MKLFKSNKNIDNKTIYTLYNTDEILPLSPKLHSEFLKSKGSPGSAEIRELTQENYSYIPLEVDISFDPITLENDFFWITQLKDNLIRNTLNIQKTFENYTEKLGYISKLNNLWQKYNKIKSNIGIEFNKIDDYLIATSPYKNQMVKITMTFGLIIPFLRHKHKQNIEKLTKNRTSLFYYYYFIKNTFLPELKETQKLLTNYQ